MKKVEISEELYNHIMIKKSSLNESFESVLRKILNIHEFDPTETKKIVFIGESGVGKSSIRELFFNYIKPEKLLKESLEPTRGLEYFNYGLYNLNCSIIDTSGQEMVKWLNEEQERVFTETDYVIFIADVREFEEHTVSLYKTIKKIALIAKSYSKNVTIALFVHKIDLIKSDKLDAIKKSISQEHQVFQLAENEDIPLFFTSILEPYIKWLNIAFMKLMKIESLLLPNYIAFLDQI